MRRVALWLTSVFLLLGTGSKAQELLYDLEVLSYFVYREIEVRKEPYRNPLKTPYN